MKKEMDQNLIHNKRDQIKKKGRKFTAAAAALTIGAMSLLTACGGNSANSPGEGSGPGGASQSAGGASGGSSAKGRFMEEEIMLPEEVADNGFVGAVQMDDKSLTFCIPDEEGIPRLYNYNTESKWTRGEAVPAPDGVKPGRMMTDGNGRLYFGGYSQEEYVFHLWTTGEDGTAQELLQDVFKVPEGESYGIMPDYIGFTSEGNILVSDSSEANLYLPDGKKTGATMAQDFIGMDVRIPACISDGDYLTLSNQKLVRYDVTKGSPVESYNLPQNPSGEGTYAGESVMQMPVFTDGDEIYIANQAGLYRIVKNGTLWEQLIDGSLNSMGRQDIYMMGFFKGGDNDYYGVFSSSESSMKLFRYYYDETVDTVPPETLTVYSLRDSSTVRQAAALLQKNNPKVKVEYRIAVDDPYEKVTEDVIRALNTELLNGKGADVLILDGLPMEAYKNKGILANISHLFETEEDLLPNIKGNFTSQDGNIYYMPARIKVPVIYGEPEAVAAFQNLEKMAAYDKTPTLFAPDIYENILNMTAYTCYNELFKQDGTVDSDVLTRWLTSVKSAGDKGNVEVSFTQSNMERFNVNNTVLPAGFGRQSDYNLITEKCAAAVELFESFDSAMLSQTAAEMTGASFESIGGVYMPCVVAGINEASANRDNAEDFIRTLFGTEVQDESLRDGFTVRNLSLDKWAEVEKEISVTMSMGDGSLMLEGEYPNKAVRESIIAIVRTANVPALIDTQIMDMIVDGSKGYLEGTGTVENAVNTIENKMKLYVNERQ